MQCGGLKLNAVFRKYHFLLRLLKQNQMSQTDSAKCIFNYAVPELYAQARRVQIVLKRRACYFRGPVHSVGNNRNITL